MNALMYILKHIRWNIPEQILIEAFTQGVPEQSLHSTSIDNRIINEVIKGRVLMDLDVLYGIEELIPLTGLYPSLDSYYNAIYVIPFERTNGRTIINCLGVGSVTLANSSTGGGHPQLPINGSMSYTNACGHNPSTANNELNKIYNSYGTRNLTDINTNCTVLGPNTILVKGFRFFTGANLAARVTVTNDENLNNIKSKTFPVVARLGELATKAYIFNKLYLALDQGMLSGGQELGRFGSIIEDYSNANEDYNVYLTEVAGKAMYMNDKQKKHRLIASMVATN